jgi:hypothetical protein
MLSDHALALLRDVFDQPDLFRSLLRIRRRVVAWGPNAKPLALDHSAVVVSEQILLESLSPGALNGGGMETSAPWTVFAAQPLPAPAVEQRFGSRMASTTQVELKEGSEPGICWIESLESGWLFLIPEAPGSGWLLSVGGPCETLLSRSQVIAGEIARHGPVSREFPAFARIVSPLCGPGWLACGTAAMAFDPICGDGTAHAVREAILASAVLRALAQGTRADNLLTHYEKRLTAGFLRHLGLCREFYRSGGTGPFWNSELESIGRGIQWCDARLQSHHSEFRYRLSGFELEAVL